MSEERTYRQALHHVEAVIQQATRQTLLSAEWEERHGNRCGCPSCAKIPEKARQEFCAALNMELGEQPKVRIPQNRALTIRNDRGE